MNIAIICPTISGREDILQNCLAAYRETCKGHDLHAFLPKDEPSWGRGVNVGMESVKSTGMGFDLIHLTADDLEPHDGWLEAAVETIYAGYYPAPQLLNPDGSLAGFGHGAADMYDVSRDWKPTLTSVVPTFEPHLWDQVGPMIDLHFYTDDYLSHKMRQLGINTMARLPYKFTHHASDVLPKSRHDRMQEDVVKYQHYLNTGEMP